MLIILSKYIVVLFGLFLISVGFLMLFAPTKARETIAKAGSTNFINYAEITIRLIPAAAMVFYADFCRYPMFFKVLGGFMIATSLLLYLVPRKYHHAYSLKSAEILKPLYIRLLFPFSMAFGGFVLYCIF
ncbi:hypothetical protein [Bernardetia sp.]|uniref:hypothetical protein n=1 Tax=Bernardetia sp. TaxID=1937974 RepID=UPI0025BE941D|nr:hypothetical protein [Bernardetia sp.]